MKLKINMTQMFVSISLRNEEREEILILFLVQKVNLSLVTYAEMEW